MVDTAEVEAVNEWYVCWCVGPVKKRGTIVRYAAISPWHGIVRCHLLQPPEQLDRLLPLPFVPKAGCVVQGFRGRHGLRGGAWG